MVDAPDAVKRHPVALCADCGGSLDTVTVAPERIIRRQVFDIPPILWPRLNMEPGSWDCHAFPVRCRPRQFI